MSIIVNKKTIYLLVIDIMFFCGLLIYSVIFFTVDKDVYGAVARLHWRQTAENIISICGSVYILGHIIAVCQIFANKALISFRRLFIYYLVQIGTMFLCTIPFAILDRTFRWDYVFPVWSTAGTLFVLIVITWGISKWNNRKMQQKRG